MVFTSQNYHDLHQRKFTAELADRMDAKVFNAPKPGGIYVVIDHRANPDTTYALDTVNRINPGAPGRDVEAAGPQLDDEHDALRKTANDRTVMVMHPEIWGKTDQVIDKFRKPG